MLLSVERLFNFLVFLAMRTRAPPYYRIIPRDLGHHCRHPLHHHHHPLLLFPSRHHHQALLYPCRHRFYHKRQTTRVYERRGAPRPHISMNQHRQPPFSLPIITHCASLRVLLPATALRAVALSYHLLILPLTSITTPHTHTHTTHAQHAIRTTVATNET